jgi:hypothetical protein
MFYNEIGIIVRKVVLPSQQPPQVRPWHNHLTGGLFRHEFVCVDRDVLGCVGDCAGQCFVLLQVMRGRRKDRREGSCQRDQRIAECAELLDKHCPDRGHLLQKLIINLRCYQIIYRAYKDVRWKRARGLML